VLCIFIFVWRLRAVARRHDFGGILRCVAARGTFFIVLIKSPSDDLAISNTMHTVFSIQRTAKMHAAMPTTVFTQTVKAMLFVLQRFHITSDFIGRRGGGAKR